MGRDEATKCIAFYVHHDTNIRKRIEENIPQVIFKY